MGRTDLSFRGKTGSGGQFSQALRVQAVLKCWRPAPYTTSLILEGNKPSHPSRKWPAQDLAKYGAGTCHAQNSYWVPWLPSDLPNDPFAPGSP